MNNKEFMQYTQEIENFYGQKLSDVERNVWYENLKFLTIERFNYIIAEIYKTNKFMPKLSEILDMHKSIPYRATVEVEEVKGYCKKCNSYSLWFESRHSLPLFGSLQKFIHPP